MQTNIDYEISQLRDAVFGEDVRSAFISCMEKLHTVSETNANIVIEAERTMNEIRDNAVNALNNLTSKLETGEFIGPPGPQGLPGEKGDTGKTGNTGERGSKWMRGTAITGIDSNGVEFPNSDIENALAGDFFINTSTNDIYECVKSGNPSTAKWAYIGNIKGNKGDRGDVGPQGTVENIDDQILTFELAENLENVKSGETVKIAFGKLMKAVGAFIVHHTQKATTSILGHIKITNSAAVTDSTGLALAATEKNAAISGTLAHQIAQISAQNNDLTNSINQINSNMNTKISAENFSYNWVAAGADYVCTIHRAGLLMIKRGTAAKLCAINPEGVVTIALEYGNESELYFAQDITIEPIPPDNDWHKVMLHNNARSGIYVFRLSI